MIGPSKQEGGTDLGLRRVRLERAFQPSIVDPQIVKELATTEQCRGRERLTRAGDGCEWQLKPPCCWRRRALPTRRQPPSVHTCLTTAAAAAAAAVMIVMRIVCCRRFPAFTCASEKNVKLSRRDTILTDSEMMRSSAVWVDRPSIGPPIGNAAAQPESQSV